MKRLLSFFNKKVKEPTIRPQIRKLKEEIIKNPDNWRSNGDYIYKIKNNQPSYPHVYYSVIFLDNCYPNITLNQDEIEFLSNVHQVMFERVKVENRKKIEKDLERLEKMID